MIMIPEWNDFYNATQDSAHWPWVAEAAARLGPPGRVLDLGAGAGRDTRYLLAQGWQVTAVDQEPAALERLAALPQANLRAVQSAIEDFPYEPASYDLISAQFALPFIPPARFAAAFAQIKQALKPGGLFTGQFFGIHDEWNMPGTTMTFLTRAEVDALLADLQVLEIREDDRPGGTATGGQKHWHVFHVLAQRVASSE